MVITKLNSQLQEDEIENANELTKLERSFEKRMKDICVEQQELIEQRSIVMSTLYQKR